MANPTIGHIDCPICKTEGEVRRYSTGTKKLYWYCQCGQIRPTSYEGQKFINENATFIGENGTPLTAAKPVNEKKEESTVKDKSLLGWFLSDDDEVSA